MIIVDDASTDQTAAVAGSTGDPRVSVLRHSTNRGPCPSRNTAIAAARGQWCVMVDSDFELMPHALAQLKDRAGRASKDVGNLASGALWDGGTISPAPHSPARELRYEDYLQWLAQLRISEKLDCVRHRVFDEVRFPDSRAWELEFHFGLAARWVIDFEPTPRMLVHSDAGNRLTTATGRDAVDRVLADANDKVASLDNVMAAHGRTLARAAPTLDRYVRSLRASQAMLAGRRRAAVREALKLIREKPISAQSWSLLFAASLTQRALARTIVWRRARQA